MWIPHFLDYFLVLHSSLVTWTWVSLPLLGPHLLCTAKNALTQALPDLVALNFTLCDLTVWKEANSVSLPCQAKNKLQISGIRKAEKPEYLMRSRPFMLPPQQHQSAWAGTRCFWSTLNAHDCLMLWSCNHMPRLGVSHLQDTAGREHFLLFLVLSSSVKPGETWKWNTWWYCSVLIIF